MAYNGLTVQEKPVIKRQTCSFFPQHIVEGLLNSRRRVSDRPSCILIFKTPARKPTIVIVVGFLLFPEQEEEQEEQEEAHRPGPTAHGPGPMAHGPWPIAHGPWPTAHGPRPSAHGPWPTAHGPRPMAHGPWPDPKMHYIFSILA